jgi:hypothetical protein
MNKLSIFETDFDISDKELKEGSVSIPDLINKSLSKYSSLLIDQYAADFIGEVAMGCIKAFHEDEDQHYSSPQELITMKLLSSDSESMLDEINEDAFKSFLYCHDINDEAIDNTCSEVNEFIRKHNLKDNEISSEDLIYELKNQLFKSTLSDCERQLHNIKTSIAYTPPFNDSYKYPCDSHVEFNGVTSSVDTIIPDITLTKLLDMLRINARDYVSHVHNTMGYDLQQEDEWIEYLESTSDQNHKTEDAVISMDDLTEIIENCCYSGNPIYFFNTSISDLIKIAEGSFSAIITGGEVGIHNFINGSGHIVTAKGPVVLEGVSSSCLFSAESGRYSACMTAYKDHGIEIYGMIKSALDANITLIPQINHENNNGDLSPSPT